MKYMLVLRASEPATESMTEDSERAVMAAYGERLVRAGVLLAAERLERGPCAVMDLAAAPGDRADSPAGSLSAFDAFWIVDVASSDEALEWARRCPMPVGSIEVRRVLGAGDVRDAGTRPGADDGRWTEEVGR
jgi:hypothetical protein